MLELPVRKVPVSPGNLFTHRSNACSAVAPGAAPKRSFALKTAASRFDHRRVFASNNNGHTANAVIANT